MSARGRAVLVLVPMLLAAALYLSMRMRIDQDFVAFLPQGSDATQRFFARQLRDSPAARVVLMRIEGGDVASLAATSEALRAALAADVHFDYVSNGSLASGMADLPALHAARYALSPDAAAHMSVDGLRDALRQRYAALGGSLAILEKRFVADDPTGETLALLAKLQATASMRRERGVWFDRDGARALLVAQTHAGASDTAGQHAAMVALDAAFAHARGAASQQLAYSSPGFLAAQSESTIAADASRASWIATLGIVAILLFAYRSVPIVALCALPAGCGLVAGLCAVTAGFGNVHAITLAFGATLIGEAVDYPSYVLTRLRGARTLEAVQRELRRPFLLAVLTTACGSMAFLASGVDGLVQLGVLTSAGIVVAGAVAWWIVPRIAPPLWRFADAGAGASRAWPVPLARWRIAGCAAISLLLLALAAGKPPWDDDPARMSPLPPRAIALDQSLRDAAGAPDASRFALVHGTDAEAVLERTEAARATLDAAVAAGMLAGYEDVARYLPSAATQRARAAALPDAETLAARIAQASDAAPFRADAFAPFVRDVADARARAPLRADAFAGTAMGLRIATLLRDDAAGSWSVIPLRGVREAGALAGRLARDPAGIAYVDLRAATGAMFAQFRARTLVAVGVGTLAILAILAIGLRSPQAALQAIAPALLGAGWVALAVIAFGGGLSLFHLIALMLVLGIGVNYALFAQAAARRGDALRDVGVTLALVSGTTAFAFAVMAVSGIPVLRAIGVTVLGGTVLTLVACTLIVHPPLRARVSA